MQIATIAPSEADSATPPYPIIWTASFRGRDVFKDDMQEQQSSFPQKVPSIEEQQVYLSSPSWQFVSLGRRPHTIESQTFMRVCLVQSVAEFYRPACLKFSAIPYR